MSNPYRKDRVELRDPLYGRVDMTEVQAVLHSPPVQRMAQVKQLGGVYVVFPCGTHSRLSHLVGAGHLANQRCSWLVENGDITTKERRLVLVSTVVHDIGHGPFSHLLESYCGNHDDRGVKLILGEMVPYLKACGVDPEEVAMINRREHPLSTIIFDNPIGVDKLDYLRRDAHFAWGDSPSFDDLYFSHVRWDRNTGLYVLPKGLQLLTTAINWSWFMYSEIYERVSSRIAQRSIQAMVMRGIEEDDVVKDRLFNGGEDGVIGAIGYWCARNPDHECAERLRRFEQRNFPKKALVYTPFPDRCPLRQKGTLAKIECSPELLVKTEDWTMSQVAEAEQRIAALLEVSPVAVTVAAAPPARRWKVPNVWVQKGRGYSLVGDLLPELHDASRMQSSIACTIAIGVDKDIRPQVVDSRTLHREIQTILEGVA